MSFPQPFQGMMDALSFFSFGFLSLDCLFEDSDHETSVYLWSSVPLAIALVLVTAHLVQSVDRESGAAAASSKTSTLTYRLLFLGYLVLPVVALKQLQVLFVPVNQLKLFHCFLALPDRFSFLLVFLSFILLTVVFQALDCVTIAERNYLRIDTSIDCDSSAFNTFRAVNGVFVAVYLATPLVWLAMLFLQREALMPTTSTGFGTKHALFLRDMNHKLDPLRFLFGIYKPQYYFAGRPVYIILVWVLWVCVCVICISVCVCHIFFFFHACCLVAST